MSLSLPVVNTGGAAVTLRVVSQPAHGSVGVSNRTATYFPEPGFVGTDAFTFAAGNGFTDSNLGTGTVSVAQGPFTVSAVAYVPPNWPAGWPAPFTVVATPVNTTAKLTYEWEFGDGTPHSTDAHASHAHAAPGTFFWSVVTRASTAQTTTSGAIVIGEPIRLSIGEEAGGVTLAWPRTLADAVLEATPTLDAAPPWMPATNAVLVGPTTLRVTVPEPTGIQFHRLRQVR